MIGRLAHAMSPKRNSFNLVRLIAAACVIGSHTFLIPNGVGASEPLQSLTGLTLGQHAVHIFFVVSGLTLTRSLESHPNIARYSLARILRIVPALAGFGLIFAFVVGPFVSKSTWSDYYFSHETWLYPFSVWLQFQHAVPPPRVFESVPIPGAVNNPLWTIKYEIFAYVGLGLLAVSSMLRRWFVVGLLMTLSAIMFALEPFALDQVWGPLFQAAKFGTCFLLGVLAYQFRDFVPINAMWLVISLAFAVFLGSTSFALLAYIILDAHLALVGGSHEYGALSVWTRSNDVSYGTYIYGWPTHQSLVALFPSVGMLSGGVLTLLIAVSLGYISWLAIEKPALRLKKRLLVVRRLPSAQTQTESRF